MPFADRVVRTLAGPVDLAVLPTAVKDVVTLRGSVDTWPNFASGEELVQDWMVQTLDKGTVERGRFEVAAILEGLGARVAFSSAAARVKFSARCLSGDVSTVVALLFEQLLQPALENEELDKTRDRLNASIRRSKTDAGYRSDVSLAESLFPDGHPNGMLTPDQEEELLAGASRDGVRELHRREVLGGKPRLAVVGDIDPQVCHELVQEAAEAWPAQDSPRPSVPPAMTGGPGERRVFIEDRENLEVRWGHPLPLRRRDDDYLAAHIASFILGGNFSARLMNEVRDKHGLTYGIGSGLWGTDVRYPGAWRIHVTLSQDNLERGIEVTEAVLDAFCTSGVTAAELAEKQQTIAGSYQVRLATTGGMAATLLQRMEEGREVSYMDRYPDLIRSLELAQVNGAIARYFDSNKLVRAVAGTLPGKHAA